MPSFHASFRKRFSTAESTAARSLHFLCARNDKSESLPSGFRATCGSPPQAPPTSLLSRIPRVVHYLRGTIHGAQGSRAPLRRSRRFQTPQNRAPTPPRHVRVPGENAETAQRSVPTQTARVGPLRRVGLSRHPAAGRGSSHSRASGGLKTGHRPARCPPRPLGGTARPSLPTFSGPETSAFRTIRW